MSEIEIEIVDSVEAPPKARVEDWKLRLINWSVRKIISKAFLRKSLRLL